MDAMTPWLEENPGTLHLDAFYARAVSEFDRRYAPGLSVSVTQQFVASVVRNAVGKLTREDMAIFLTEVPELLQAEAGRAFSKEAVAATLTPEALSSLCKLIADDLQGKLLERAQAEAQAA